MKTDRRVKQKILYYRYIKRYNVPRLNELFGNAMKNIEEKLSLKFGKPIQISNEKFPKINSPVIPLLKQITNEYSQTHIQQKLLYRSFD